jgi:hypothetical protein
MMVSTGQKIQSKRLADFPRRSPQHKSTMLREDAAQRPRQFILQQLQLAIEGDVFRVWVRRPRAVQLHKFIRDLGDGNLFTLLQAPAPERL